ncbi:MAG: hypothetical protein A3B74_01270 [Candidatus Kerfeldbacteria bacterium RIFCSPHIGHO2_02_FULL_42_14]|uniref:LD-carboxypeptidase n=1 Tax=Candidatus Kerfeldbacteria bacterium RIFCSPHIGHO2_02_FULL_42_14 TaxID=1798540 RepID=A0A1G2ANA9_9BACT|nr:MAG: hypothetical protein A3B74_01270 [Candidatus Kerfeldbacteria bacterium RIFCSPHIGHO2_02_FULL_42_14]OGY81134.1 MAG: hypothetical protein A3E60_04735 [Candidatus Kerfeldbacteria bacterium RIFCSPHIGHO2_12_FULL_42_13]OGY84214.1 MAG: hypothetical protein A3I91_05460 [Candidatus Kerfeldbacteria bacterium RIFCSPLOWO2_02_FULL_42_19]OGY87489.1 MAG: hypothetical protein A3G01_02450 [Candidatus Kerfeldbacteria bacterium RIFCSPLOWO2_12_FULL_43_9]
MKAMSISVSFAILMHMTFFKPLKKNDQITVIAPSRPILHLQKDIQKSMARLKKEGFRLIMGRNIHKKNFYAAGTVQERIDDFQNAFNDSKTRLVLCATGGSSSNQLLGEIDFTDIKKYPKLLVGYSDNTTLLLAMYSQTGMAVFHGPDMAEYFHLNTKAKKCFLEILGGKIRKYNYPKKMNVIRSGTADGILLGGNLTSFIALLGTKYSPDYKNAVLFWEEVGESPAAIHFKLQQFKLSGHMKHLAGMIIGHLSEYEDKKYPEDFRKIDDIILEVAGEYTFPIIKVDYFGHNIDDFLTFPIGAKTHIDTQKFLFTVENPVNKKISHES